jgi:hypothetical protein
MQFYIFKNFINSYTKNAGQKIAFMIPNNPTQNDVAVDIK